MRQRALLVVLLFIALVPAVAFARAVPSTSAVSGSIAGTISRASDATPVSGATVQAVLTGIVVQATTSAGDGSYALTVPPGTYDVRVSAAGFCNEARSGISVSDNATSTVNVAMSQPGSAIGTVTQADRVTAISGAAVTLFLGSTPQGTTNTDASGNYAVANLHPGGYTLQVVSVGYQTAEVQTALTEATATTTNVSLTQAPPGSITYMYDDLNRLVTVVDASGQAANYAYDLVGNLLAITRLAPGALSISAFSPTSGAPGTAVTIYGTGFSTTPSQNNVSFNGTAATVTSSTANQIVTSVPQGATTGPITVVTPAGSATSSSVFTRITARWACRDRRCSSGTTIRTTSDGTCTGPAR